jgi:signal transduction histidine kinase
MNALTVIRRKPLALLLATIAAASMVAINESAYHQSVGSLGEAALAAATPGLTARHEELLLALLIGRIGVAVLSAVSLLALFWVLRQALMLTDLQQEQQRLAQVERERLEIEVLQRTTQLTELTRHLQTAREDERQRLARDLHDELGALLTSAKLDAARLRSRLTGAAPEALDRLGHLVSKLDSGIALGRKIIEDLRPSTLGHLGLVPTLEILLREYSERSGTQVHATLAPVALRSAAELVVYRIVQESITNTTKYARASQVWVTLAPQPGRVRLTVRDDGVGFDPRMSAGSAFGLLGMRFRIEAEGGTMSLISAPGRGTCIDVSLPESADA